MQEEKKNNSTADIPIEPEQTFLFEPSGGEMESSEPYADLTESAALSAEEGQEPYTPKKKKHRFGGVIYVVSIVLFSVLLGVGIIMVGNDVFGMFKEDKNVQVNIPEGASTADIANILKGGGIIEHPWLFQVTSRLGHHDGTYQWGLFELSPRMPYSEIIYALQQIAPDIETVTMNISGSMSVVEIANMLESNKICTSEEFLGSLQSESHGFDFEREMLVDRMKFQKTEGYMYPGNYTFFVGENADTVIEKIYQSFDQNVCQNLKEELAESNMSLERVLTLASLIEAENVDPAEMPDMASVLFNRMNNPMKYPRFELKTTRNYVDQIIKRYSVIANAEMCDAYDTFVCDGLPIGPICNPGVDAIRAVLEPAQSNYYFYYVDPATKAVQYMETQDEYERVVAAADVVS